MILGTNATYQAQKSIELIYEQNDLILDQCGVGQKRGVEGVGGWVEWEENKGLLAFGASAGWLVPGTLIQLLSSKAVLAG